MPAAEPHLARNLPSQKLRAFLVVVRFAVPELVDILGTAGGVDREINYAIALDSAGNGR